MTEKIVKEKRDLKGIMGNRVKKLHILLYSEICTVYCERRTEQMNVRYRVYEVTNCDAYTLCYIVTIEDIVLAASAVASKRRATLTTISKGFGESDSVLFCGTKSKLS